MDDQPLDPYAALGLKTTATPAEVKAAWLSMAMRLHPDHGGTNEEFARAKAAYDILSDQFRRARYDHSGSTAEGKDREREDAEQIGRMFDALFEDFIGGADDMHIVYTNPLAILQAKVQEKADKADQALAAGRKARANLATMLERLKDPAGQQSGMREVMQQLLVKTDVRIDDFEHLKANLDRMSKDLGDHGYDVAPPPASEGFSSGGMSFEELAENMRRTMLAAHTTPPGFGLRADKAP